ncbi:hypothetical protein LEP1GSC133_1490 [Leptospira borgpetersenii serovar Pomona str. 200901868]|uniref:Uncharacterized protein n=1 Tax=Leptospira borgpetersenii serovar Pomona str. 200901868 TaxID=1192866 RepID=M6W7U9_LEPBO|nr:hypothetical protein LEP1GSC133_1490 [Leptospira borgpetersenii serovar Pomona str. 200901868]
MTFENPKIYFIEVFIRTLQLDLFNKVNWGFGTRCKLLLR